MTQTHQDPSLEIPTGNGFLGRIAPAAWLFLVAPLIAEFLLGDLPLKLLPALILLAPLYGGGALLVRETVRRTRRGWPSIVLLGLAYAVLEEAFTTQSLFNPDYLHLHLHLLDAAYVPALGMGGWWTMLMLNLHAAWSIATPIALVEACVPRRASAPWLGRTGYLVTAAVFVAGAAATTLMTLKQDPFKASYLQLGSAALVCAALVTVALLQPRLPGAPNATEKTALAPSPRLSSWASSPWLWGTLGLAAGSAVLLVPKGWGWGAAALLLAVDAVVVGAVFFWSRHAAWDIRHKLALAAGAALAYAWHAFVQTPVVPASVLSVRVGNAIFAAGAVGLIWFATRRTSAALEPAQRSPAQW